MRGRLLRVVDRAPDDEAAWRDLARRAVEPNPFLEPECLIPAAVHQSFGSEIGLVVAEEDGRWYACFPVRSVSSWNRFRYPIVTTQARRMTYLGTPLMDGNRGVDAFGSILSTLRDDRRWLRSRVLALQWINEEGPVAVAMRAAVGEANLDLFELESFERGLLSRRPEPTYDLIQSSGDRRERRRCLRRLTEELGEEPKLVVRTGDPAAIEQYIALEAAGYKGDTGAAMATVPGEIEYFREMCAGFTAQGRLHVLALQAGDQTLAMQILMRGGDGLFAAKTSYDERYARFGPGVEMQMSTMMYFHESTDAAWLDTCTFHKNTWLLRLYPERRRIASWLINLGGPVDNVALRGFFAAKALHKRKWDRTEEKEQQKQSRPQPAGAPAR